MRRYCPRWVAVTEGREHRAADDAARDRQADAAILREATVASMVGEQSAELQSADGATVEIGGV